MSVIPVLKKKLRSINATKKVAKAMKTVSAVKFSKLNGYYKTFANYEKEYEFLYRRVEPKETDDCVVILGSNKGFCGGFNNDIVSFAKPILEQKNEHLIVCGERLASILSQKYDFESYSFSDVPSYDDCKELFDRIEEIRGGNTEFQVKIIYPSYKNTMTQVPTEKTITISKKIADGADESMLFVPDRESVIYNILFEGFYTLIYGTVLETALGAQASTLMTMRSAFDTATQYSESLESEIHRKRQSEVTADVIETSVKGENNNG